MEFNYYKTSTEKSETKAGAFALFVPLYLVILAFFILLTTISEENPEKKDGAITSIGDSFAKGAGKTDRENKALFFDFAQIVTTYFDDVEKELKSSFKPDEFIFERKGYKMRIKIPLRKIFEKDSSTIISFQDKLFDRLVKVISLERHGVVVKINIKVDSKGFVSLGNQDPFKIDKERSTKVLEHFIKNGIHKKHITAGLTFNDEENLLIETNVEKEDGILRFFRQ